MTDPQLALMSNPIRHMFAMLTRLSEQLFGGQRSPLPLPGLILLLGKDCTSSDQCAVTTVYNCCIVYTGIRADAKAAFESAQADHTRACPDLRGCQCQDHTETNELVPLHQPPLPVTSAQAATSAGLFMSYALIFASKCA